MQSVSGPASIPTVMASSMLVVYSATTTAIVRVTRMLGPEVSPLVPPKMPAKKLTATAP